MEEHNLVHQIMASFNVTLIDKNLTLRKNTIADATLSSASS